MKQEINMRRLTDLKIEVYQSALKQMKGRSAQPNSIGTWVQARIVDFLDSNCSAFLSHLSDSADDSDPNSSDRVLSKIIREIVIHEDDKEAPVQITTALSEAIGKCDIVISATNATGNLIDPADLKSGAVVCDVSKPPDLSTRVSEQRTDVLVMEGGLVQWPDRVGFGQNLGYPDGINLACLSETVILALEKAYQDISVGSKLNLDEIALIRELARKHGFSLGPIRNFGIELSDADVSTIQYNVNKKREQGEGVCVK
jgi:hypothetical protein